jgi:hypothetical protein
MDSGALDRIRLMLTEFIDGTNRSTLRAGELEVAIDHGFPGDPRFEGIVLSLASYSPSGGEFLLGEADLVKECRHALKLIG